LKAKIFALDRYIRLDHRAATVVLAYSALLEKGRTDELPGDFPKAVQPIVSGGAANPHCAVKLTQSAVQ
jgi:hypothetical protein